LALLPAVTAIREHPFLPPAIGTGVLGGFTTMSAYAVQSRDLIADHHTDLAALYLIGTFAVALLAVALADEFSSRSERLEFEEEEGDL
jgi:CrcB protein